MSEKRFFTTLANDEYTLIQEKGDLRATYLKYSEVVDLLNYQDRLIEEQHDEIINWTKKYVGIKKENEQLKQRIKELEE